MFCVNCGVEIEEEFEFCPECGVKIVHPLNESQIDNFNNYTDSAILSNNSRADSQTEKITQTGSAKNKWVALVLCIFLGGIGVHRYYEGKIISGVIYTLTLGLFGIGWFVDVIRIAMKPNPYYV